MLFVSQLSEGNAESVLRAGFQGRGGRRRSGGFIGQWLESRNEEAVSCLIRTELSEEQKSREILVVDDEAVNQFLMKELLQEVGFKVTMASTGQEALDILTKRYDSGGTASFPDLCLMDLMMPGLSGQDAVEGLRMKYPGHRMPIIMLSAVDDEPAMVQALQNGCVDYISKPFKAAELFARVALQLRTFQNGLMEMEGQLLQQLQLEFFPPYVVDRLGSGQKLVADVFDCVSIVSVGISGLTNLAYSKEGALDTVNWIDQLFSSVDSKAQEAGFQSGLGIWPESCSITACRSHCLALAYLSMGG